MHTVKKLEVDLTQENVISVALWIHLGPGSGPPPVAYTVVKVGGGTGQDPATEVTHLRLNQPPVFSSVPKLFSEHSLQSENIRL